MRNLCLMDKKSDKSWVNFWFRRVWSGLWVLLGGMDGVWGSGSRDVFIFYFWSRFSLIVFVLRCIFLKLWCLVVIVSDFATDSQGFCLVICSDLYQNNSPGHCLTATEADFTSCGIERKRQCLTYSLFTRTLKTSRTCAAKGKGDMQDVSCSNLHFEAVSQTPSDVFNCARGESSI